MTDSTARSGIPAESGQTGSPWRSSPTLPVPESSLPTGSAIYRVVCDQHVNGHGTPGGWYNTEASARVSFAYWVAHYPNCTGWRVEVRRLTPWEAVDA